MIVALTLMCRGDHMCTMLRAAFLQCTAICVLEGVLLEEQYNKTFLNEDGKTRAKVCFLFSMKRIEEEEGKRTNECLIFTIFSLF